MAEPRVPGVYFEEAAQRVRVSAANATLAGFVGTARRGRTDKTELVRGLAEYTDKYGGIHAGDVDLGVYLDQFFANRGGQARVLRVVGSGAVAASNTASVLDHDGVVSFDVHASNPGAWGNDLVVELLRHEVQAIGLASANDGDGNELPNAIDNVNSMNGGRLTLPALSGLTIGDVLDVVNPATGVVLAEGPIVVTDFDAPNTAIHFVAPAGFIAACPANAILRTNSMHRTRTRATAQLNAAATEVTLASADGLGEGSLLALHLFSHHEGDVNQSLAFLGHAIVDRVVGTRAIFTAAMGNAVAVPNSVAATLLWIVDVPLVNGLRFTANDPGPSGNSISVSVTLAQAANTVTVVGRHVRVAVAAVLGWTTTQIRDAINAHATASRLVTAALVGIDDAPIALNQTALTGGADLLVESLEFGMSIQEAGADVETTGGWFEYLSTVPASRDYVATRLGGTLVPNVPDDRNPSRRIILAHDGVTDVATTEVNQMPRAVASVTLSGGLDGDPPLDEDYVGLAAPRSGFFLFDDEQDVDMLAVPGQTSPDLQRALVAYASGRGDLIALLDAPSAARDADALLSHRQVDLGIDDGFGQLFAPWGRVRDPRPDARRGDLVDVPPTPMVAGLISAAIDDLGPHASVGNQQPVNWIGVTVGITHAEHGPLNEAGVCIVRPIAQRGLRVFGDRTLLQNGDGRKFGNVRRWLNYARQSIRASLGAVIFRPANTDLMDEVAAAITSFLDQEWRNGALVPRDNRRAAFYVKVDQETTTSADLEDGIVRGEVGVSVVTPAERIIFRLNVSSGGVSVDEV